ncbi:MAG: hypothetical protein L0I76_19400 [Pseudonocardia sp.]|nr:hypothetical protein [Actinomycetes bacterium]MDN5917238.1 hypothetical protein [Pseudonocardia sp.]
MIRTRRAGLLSILVLCVMLTGCSATGPAPTAAPGPESSSIVEPAEGEAIPSEQELSGFVPLGEWVTFANGTRLRVTMREVSVEADSRYPDSYPPVDRALEVITEVDNPTSRDVENVAVLGPVFAYIQGGMSQYLSDQARNVDLPRLLRAGTTATIVGTYTLNPPETEWPEGAEFTCAVRAPVLAGDPYAGESGIDEIAEWMGVPATS